MTGKKPSTEKPKKIPPRKIEETLNDEMAFIVSAQERSGKRLLSSVHEVEVHFGKDGYLFFCAGNDYVYLYKEQVRQLEKLLKENKR